MPLKYVAEGSSPSGGVPINNPFPNSNYIHPFKGVVVGSKPTWKLAFSNSEEECVRKETARALVAQLDSACDF